MSKDKQEKKKKDPKKKIKYIDDGRSLSDMSGVGQGRVFGRGSAKGSFGDQAKTFFAAMKMMIVPMLITMGIITIAFFCAWLFFTLAG